MARLALTSLALSHFRSHRSARLEFDGRPVAIHGPNGAGKTNILEAVSLLSPGSGLRRAAAGEMTRRPERLGWKVVGGLEAPGGAHEIALRAGPGEARQVAVDGKASTQAALGRIARIVWLTPAMDRIWNDGAGERRRFLDRLTLSLEPGHAKLSIAYEKAMRERNRLLKDQAGDARWYVAVERQMAEAGVAIQANRRSAIGRLAAAQAGADSAFPAAALSLDAREGGDTPETAEAFAEALARGRPRDLRAGRTLAGPHRADLEAVYSAKGAAARDCSTGEQKALLLSLALANARALAKAFGAPPILLLDEVAAHLDDERRAALFGEICAIGAQALMTGTRPGLFDALGERAQRVAVSEADGESVIRA